ncbi:exported hypothetical protein [uncultured Gammaproteobacteria bacterium]
MRKILIAMLFVLMPLSAIAQQQNGPVPKTLIASQFIGMTTDQALAVGLGVIGGAIALNAMLGGGSATLVGAVAGAMIGNWWFEHNMGAEIRPGVQRTATAAAN